MRVAAIIRQKNDVYHLIFSNQFLSLQAAKTLKQVRDTHLFLNQCQREVHINFEDLNDAFCQKFDDIVLFTTEGAFFKGDNLDHIAEFLKAQARERAFTVIEVFLMDDNAQDAFTQH